jgi:hypothetical protein
MIGRGEDKKAQETVVNAVSRLPMWLAFPTPAANIDYHWMRHRSSKALKGRCSSKNFRLSRSFTDEASTK